MPLLGVNCTLKARLFQQKSQLHNKSSIFIEAQTELH